MIKNPYVDPENFDFQQLDIELDLSEIIKLAGDDATFIQDLLNLYIEQFNQIHCETLESLQQQDTEALRRIFHKMKPSINMLKQQRMQALIDEAHSRLHCDEPDFNLITSLTMAYLEEMEKLKKLLTKQLENKNFVVD